MSGWSASWVARWPPRSTVSAATCPPTSSRPRSCRPAATPSMPWSASAAGRPWISARPSCSSPSRRPGIAGAPPTSTGRPCPTSPSPPPTRAPSSRTFFGMTDPSARRTKGGGGGPTTAPVAAVYDPELTRRHAGPGHGRDRRSTRWPTASRRRGRRAALTRGRGGRPGRRPARSTTRCPLVVDDPERPRGPHRPCSTAPCSAGRGAPERHDGRAPRPRRSSSAAGPASPTAWPTPSCCRTRCGSTRRWCPRPWPRSPTRSVAGRRRPRSRCCASARGLPSRLRDVGVSEDDLDAVARLSQGNPTVARNPRPVSEEDARAILAAAY